MFLDRQWLKLFKLRTLLSHPWLLEENAEEIAALTFQNAAFGRLRDEMLSLQAGEKPLDSEALHTQLSRNDDGVSLKQVDRAITHKSDWFAEAGASRRDVATGWRQIVALHRRSGELERELEAALRAYNAEETDTAYARLCDIRRQISALDGTEALVEGYGEGSGRATGTV